MKKIVTRFAPSPTGNLHLGGFRTALFNYLYAKHFDGKVLLRIEDTDKIRSKPEYEKNILDGLAWLGLDFAETFRQSERTKIHAAYLAKLIENGHAYLSDETEANAKAEDGANLSKTVIRFKNPKKVITFQDIIRGDISFDTTELGDFVIAKNAEEPLYNFAVVVDDFEMGVTHVIRGEDHISNTPRQILIATALGAPIPVYAHLPLILAPDKSKLSKRKGALSLTEYKDRGYLPEALINYMAMLGWNPGTDEEMFSLPQLIKIFDVANVQKSGAVYNEDKLKWVNREYLKRKTHKEIATEARPFIEASQKSWEISDDLLLKLVPILLDRMNIYSDITAMFDAGELDFFFETPKYDVKDLIWRDEKDYTNTKEFLTHTIGVLESADAKTFETSEGIKNLLWNYATEKGRGSVLWPIRFALSGKAKSPDPFILMSVLGRDESIKRLKHAVEILG